MVGGGIPQWSRYHQVMKGQGPWGGDFSRLNSSGRLRGACCVASAEGREVLRDSPPGAFAWAFPLLTSSLIRTQGTLGPMGCSGVSQ